MPDQTSLDSSYLFDQILKWSNVLVRPAVQIQLLAIAGSIALAWLISKWVWLQIRRRFPSVKSLVRGNVKLSGWQYGVLLLRYLLTTVLSFISIQLLRSWFLAQGWVAGLLSTALELLWLYLLYRCFIILFYGAFPEFSLNQARFRFLAPLFCLFAIGKIISLQTELRQLTGVVLIKLFGSSITLGTVFLATVGLYFWIVGVSFGERLLLHILSVGSRVESGALQAASLIARYLLITLGIVLIFGYIGFNPTAFAAITGGLSVGIGFGLREVISNFVSGIWLLFEGALKPGDIVEVKGEISEVKQLGIRASTVRVIRDNSEKIIPNQTFFTNEVTTYTGSDRLIVCSLEVGASYKCNPKKVIEVLLKVTDQHAKVLKKPTPLAFFTGFGESSLDFELRFWLHLYNPVIIKMTISEIGCAIWEAFAEHGLEIPYPQRDLHIRSDDKVDG